MYVCMYVCMYVAYVLIYAQEISSVHSVCRVCLPVSLLPHLSLERGRFQLDFRLFRTVIEGVSRGTVSAVSVEQHHVVFYVFENVRFWLLHLE